MLFIVDVRRHGGSLDFVDKIGKRPMRALEVKIDGKLRCRVGQENIGKLWFLLNADSIDEVKVRLHTAVLSENENTHHIAEWLVEKLNLDQVVSLCIVETDEVHEPLNSLPTNQRQSPAGKPELSCSFCGKSELQIAKLIAGPSVFICNECVDLCNEINLEDALDRHEKTR